MAIDLTSLSSKVQRYREQSEPDVAALGVATGIEPERLLKFGLGKVKPTGEEILILSGKFRCAYTFFILIEQVAPFLEAVMAHAEATPDTLSRYASRAGIYQRPAKIAAVLLRYSRNRDDDGI